MSWLLAGALFAIGILLLDSSQFIGFLTILAGVFALLVKPSRAAHAVAAPQQAYSQPQIIIKSGGHAPNLERIKLRVKEGWTGTTSYEDLMTNLSDLVLFPVKILWRLLRIGRGAKKK
ncbi:MAG: hypothetical protein QXR53_01820 [Candidatus Norongarragalinales archaeon]